ncbi:MAG TPA: FtsX-like permease family protein [Acidimicrobiales bacterium]
MVGIGGGLALAALAGARRSEAAMPQFVAYSLPDDGGFLYGSLSAPGPAAGAGANSLALPPLAQRVVDLPQVAAYFRAPHLFVTTDPSGRHNTSAAIIGTTDADLYHRVDRPLVVAGHLPDPSRPFDVAINEVAAEQDHLHVGSRLHLYAYSAAQFHNGALTGGVELRSQAPVGPRFTVRVVAIVRSPQDVNAVVPLLAKQDVSYEGDQNVYTTPAFLPRLAAGLHSPVQQVAQINLVGVRLRHGAADWQAFSAAANTIGHGRIFTSAGNVYNIRTDAASAERGIHLEAVALLLFGAIAGLVTLLLVGQAIARQVMLESDDLTTLRSLGATRSQLLLVVSLRSTVIAVAGGVLAVAVAVLCSPLMPLGLARQAEIHLGFNVDVLVLVPGFFAVIVLIAARSMPPAWRASRRSLASTGDSATDVRLSRTAEAVSRTSLSPVASIGVRYGLEPGRGRTAVPLFSAAVGAVVAVTALVAALTFGASLGHLLDSPRQQGWNWDVLVGNPNSTTDQEASGGALLAHNRFVGSYSAIAILAGAEQGNVVIDGRVVDLLLAFDPVKGTVYPPLVQGHVPRAGDEVVLASKTLQALHRHIGQAIQVAGGTGRPRTLHIVGSMIAPSVGDLFTNGMGDGGWVYGPAVRQQLEQAPPSANGPPATVFTLFAVRYAHGVSPAMAYASLRHDFGATVLTQLPSEDVLNLQSVDGLPPLLAALVVFLGVATVGNTLVASVRQRRRELAILKTIGFVRRQVAAVVAWQATSFSLVALVVGIPLGVVGGRWAWNLVASGIGSVSPPVVPTVAIVVTVPAALVVANVMAAWPGWVAARVAPAVVMRNE